MNALYQAAERLMRMDDATWERHANPWSAYTRFSALPLLALAIWSRDWIGAWAWLAVAAALFWIWLNPRAFPPPKRLTNWASKAVLGERVFLGRRAEVAAHHVAWANRLSLMALPGAVTLAVGLWRLDLGMTLSGMFLTILPKMWFCDRMVWLYADWRAANEKALGDV